MSQKNTRKSKPSQQAGLSSYGVKRSTGRSTARSTTRSAYVVPATPITPAQPTPIKKKKHIFRWIGLAVLVLVVSFGIYTYIRVSSFVTSSFNGHSEASLLTPLATIAKPSPSATPTATQPSAAAPTSSNTEVTTAAITPQPTSTPVPVIQPTATPANLPAIIQKIKDGQPMTALFLGYGGQGHDGAYLTDTILELTYDPTQNAVTMVNIPRDLYMFIPYGGTNVGYWGKINSAFSYVMQTGTNSGLSPRYQYDPNDQNSRIDAGVNLTKDLVEKVTGIPVDYWAILSFDGFRKFIDAIGGIDVNVQTAFDDYDYPANDDPSIDASVMHIHFDVGLQHLTGERAIEYSRSRKSLQDGNDFSRSKRQMNVVTAVKTKVSQPAVMLKAFDMMDALQGNLRTSLSLDDAHALLDYFQGDGAATLQKVMFVPEVLSTDNFLGEGTSNDGADILFPLAGQSNFKPIQQWLSVGQQFPALQLENIKVQVQNGTGMTAPVKQLTEDLEQNGVNVISSIWANNTDNTVIYDYSGGKDPNTLKVILGLLPNSTVRILDKPANQTSDIVILVGRDYQQIADDSTNNVSSGSNENKGITPIPVNIPSNALTPKS